VSVITYLARLREQGWDVTRTERKLLMCGGEVAAQILGGFWRGLGVWVELGVGVLGFWGLGVWGLSGCLHEWLGGRGVLSIEGLEGGAEELVAGGSGGMSCDGTLDDIAPSNPLNPPDP
jgi:hypothetical protein